MLDKRRQLPIRSSSSCDEVTMPSPSGGRVVLVTGAAGGIGRAMTEALLADGHSIAAVDRDAPFLRERTM